MDYNIIKKNEIEFGNQQKLIRIKKSLIIKI